MGEFVEPLDAEDRLLEQDYYHECWLARAYNLQEPFYGEEEGS